MQLRDMDEVRFLSFAFERIERSKSQILQDLWVAFELSEKRDGFFVEFGATDGRTNSNTWLLEKTFGWKGLLAEPNPMWHAALQKNRTCAVDHRCVYSRTGETVAFATASDPELSAIVETGGRDHFAATRNDAPVISVPTVTLADLLVDHGAPKTIDYLSVDTEGSELEILEKFDFERWNVQLISVEHNNTPQEARIADLLDKHGFTRRFPEFSQWDAWYARRN